MESIAAAIQLFRHLQISENGESMELVFEFFENDQPQQRKPLYHKVRDMIKLLNSDHHVLDSMDLCNIHPSSWYSVAWYPIYRVPEGIFRASFLTYHSLGYLVQRCNPTPQNESHFCVVSPALGLQSYNTQWWLIYWYRTYDEPVRKSTDECIINVKETNWRR